MIHFQYACSHKYGAKIVAMAYIETIELAIVILSTMGLNFKKNKPKIEFLS